ncbi:hypothetical protein AB3331_01115 [Streptococcus sp. H49]
MASDAGITLTTIFFTRILGRVQFNKIQSPYKTAEKQAPANRLQDTETKYFSELIGHVFTVSLLIIPKFRKKGCTEESRKAKTALF